MTQERALSKRDPGAIMEQVITKGDLALLTSAERTDYYLQVCESVGVNPLTKPFAYLEIDGKMLLYALRDCTDQLRATRKININITSRERVDDVYLVTARAVTPDGRTDESIGAVALAKEDGEWQTSQNNKRYFKGSGIFKPMHGDALANALMKAETKAKRRVTLSIAGLGWLDETEIETIQNARVVPLEPRGQVVTAFTENPTEFIPVPTPPVELPVTINYNPAGLSPDPVIEATEEQETQRLSVADMRTKVDAIVRKLGYSPASFARQFAKTYNTDYAAATLDQLTDAQTRLAVLLEKPKAQEPF